MIVDPKKCKSDLPGVDYETKDDDGKVVTKPCATYWKELMAEKNDVEDVKLKKTTATGGANTAK